MRSARSRHKAYDRNNGTAWFYVGLAGSEIPAGALFLELIVDYPGGFKAVPSSHLYPFRVIGQQAFLFNLREPSTK